MKKIYLALMCTAGLTMMTACGGDKKAEQADAENQEVVNEDEQNADEQEAEAQEGNDQADVWGEPAKADIIDLMALYAAGDFKPAAHVVFEDTLGGEKVGELPSKWDIVEGSAEVAETKGHGYITMDGGNTTLIPTIDGNKVTLPASYTTEFEFMFGKDNFYVILFYNAEDEEVGNIRFWLCSAEWNFAKTNDEWIHGDKDEMEKLFSKNGWNHFAASFEKANMKLFFNGKRVANLPNIKQASYFKIIGEGADGSSHYIKSIRIAQ